VLPFRAVLDGRQSLVPAGIFCALPSWGIASPSAGSWWSHRYIGFAASSSATVRSALPWAERGRFTQPEADLEVCLHSGDVPRDWDDIGLGTRLVDFQCYPCWAAMIGLSLISFSIAPSTGAQPVAVFLISCVGRRRRAQLRGADRAVGGAPPTEVLFGTGPVPGSFNLQEGFRVDCALAAVDVALVTTNSAVW